MMVFGQFLAVFLDLPAPWDAIKSSKEALKVSVPFAYITDCHVSLQCT